jgi:flagellar motor switch protein FliG
MASAAPAPLLTGPQKTATLLVALGDEASGALLKHLSDEEVELAVGAIANLPAVSLEQAEAILQEFQDATNGALQLGHGGPEYARRVLTQAFGPDGSKKHIERLPLGRGQQTSFNQQLQRVEPQLLAHFVRSEHPQTVALILSRLTPAQSAAVLALMEPDSRMDVAVRVARLERISPAVVAKIAQAVGMKLKSFGEVQRESSDGARAMAEIFNQMDPNVCDEILLQMGEEYAELADQIRQKMFVFEDVLSIDGPGITEVLSRADRRQLTVALKGASEELRQHLLKGLSQRGAAMLLEDMEALGPIKIRDVEGAQQQIIAVIRQLESEGVISRNRGGGNNEQYV